MSVAAPAAASRAFEVVAPRERQLHPAWASGLVTLLLVLMLYGPGMVRGGVLVPMDMLEAFSPWNAGLTPSRPANGLLGDQVQQMYPWRVFVHHELAEGRFPLWTPYNGGGTPLFANGQAAVLFPLNLLTLPLSPEWAATLVQLVKPVLAAIGVALFLRALRVSRLGCIVAGVAWAFAGPMVTWLGWPHTNALLVLPYLFWATTRWLQTLAWRWWLVQVGAVTIQLLAGHPESTAHSILALGIYVCVWLVLPGEGQAGAWPERASWRWLHTWPGRRLTIAATWGASVAAGSLLAGVQVIPLLEAIGYSVQAAERSGGALSRVVLERETLLTWLIPNYFGTPLAQTFGPLNFLNYNETLGYVGVATLVLAAVAPLHRQRRAWLGLVVLTIVACGLTYGLPVLTELRRLPGLGVAANTRFVFIMAFGVACLAGLGVDVVRGSGRRWLRWAPAAALAAVAGGALILALSPSALMPDATGAAPLAPLEAVVWRQGQLWRLAGLAMLGAVALAVTSFRGRVGVVGACLLVVVAAGDSSWFAAGYNPVIEAARVSHVPPALSWVQTQGSEDRLIALGDALLPDASMLYGISDLRVYEPVAFHRVLRLFERLDPNIRDDVRARFYLFVYHPRVELLSLAGVRWVLAPVRDPRIGDANWLAAAGFHRRYDDDATAIWENASFLPHAYFTSSIEVVDGEGAALDRVATWTAGQAAVVERDPAWSGMSGANGAALVPLQAEARPGRAEVRVDAPSEGVLVINDAWYPGWVASVDGQEVPLLHVNYLFMGVPISAGSHHVIVEYRPRSFVFGAGISIITLLLLAGLGVSRRLGLWKRWHFGAEGT